MHVIIDGYNLSALLARTGEPHSEAARESLLRLLAGYRHRKGHSLTVVFDGWQRGQPIEGREHRAGVQVIYSKRGERADQVIERLAREYGAECAVVTSDQEVIRAVGSERRTFDLVLADPPYDYDLTRLAPHLARLVAPDGLLVLESSSREDAPQVPGLEERTSRKYGSARLTLFTR